MDNAQHPPLDAGAVAAALQASILHSTDVNGFLADVAAHAAQTIGHGAKQASCGITLITRQRLVSVASSDTLALHLDETQHKIGAGPCLAAAQTHAPMSVTDTLTETRWPGYLASVSDSGVRSILSIPFEVDGDASGVLNLYATEPDAFPEHLASRALAYARQASVSLRLALLIADLAQSKRDVLDAIQTRTNITLAQGILMARHGCSRERAYALLLEAGTGPDTTLAETAAVIIGSIEDPRDATGPP